MATVRATGSGPGKATDRLVIEKVALDPEIDDKVFAKPQVGTRSHGGVIVDAGKFDWGNGKFPVFTAPAASIAMPHTCHCAPRGGPHDSAFSVLPGTPGPRPEHQASDTRPGSRVPAYVEYVPGLG